MKTILILLILVGGGVGGWFYFRNNKTDAPEYLTQAVQRGDVTEAVTATGTLNPVVNVQVGSQISGNIQKLNADFNSEVKKGQVVAQLDPATFQAAVNQSEGELANAQAQLKMAELNASRQRELAKNKISTQADLDQAEVSLLQAQSSVKIRTAQVEKAKVDLGRCTIYSPIDGIVISRSVDVGQTVAASMSAPVIFQIANDLRNMQIDANVAEADVGNIAVDQKVDFTVEAFQFRMFHGKVAQVRNAPITVQNVVSYDTVIAVTNEDLKLKPGMTATVSIVIAERKDVVKVPNASLRFRPVDAPTVPKAGAPASGQTPGASGGGGGGSRGERRGPPGGGGSGRSRSREREKGGPMERTIYTLVDGKPQPVTVKLGISDGIFTEVIEGLKEGDQVITGTAMAQTPATPPQSGNPLSGSSGRRRF